MAPRFLLYYLEMPLTAFLQATGFAKKAMYNNLFGTIIKILIIFIFGLLKIGIYNLIIAIITCIIVVTLLHLISTKKVLNKNI